MSIFSALFSKSESSQTKPDTLEAARRVAAGNAILIDVREPDEWAETGVAAPAITLAMSDLNAPSDAWKRALESNKTREIFVYCRSGGRSGRVAKHLRSQGFNATNIGGFSDWADAGLPVRRV